MVRIPVESKTLQCDSVGNIVTVFVNDIISSFARCTVEINVTDRQLFAGEILNI